MASFLLFCLRLERTLLYNFKKKEDPKGSSRKTAHINMSCVEFKQTGEWWEEWKRIKGEIATQRIYRILGGDSQSRKKRLSA